MPERRSFITRLLSDELQLPVAIAAGIALALGVPLWFWGSREPQTQLMLIASIAGQVFVWTSLALGAIHGLQAAWVSIRSFNPSIDVLMVVGAGLSAAIGHPEEGALLLFLFTLSGALEHRALAKAKDAVARLHKLMPKNAMLKRGSNWEPVDAEQLRGEDIVLVRPGETVPADGVVTGGHSSLDQSSLTGESLPRSVDEGDQVFAGTLNKEGALEVRVTRPVAESSIKRILQLVLEAQERRQPIQRVIDRFSTPYTLAVFAVAILALLGFWFWGHLPESGGPMKFTDALYRAITLLVVCSPCALVISTPTATLCGLSRAARGGVLIKGGDALERLANVRQVALDKTGTLTTGRIEVTKLEPIAAADVDSLLSLAMAAEQRSTHPIASAIVRLAESHSLDPAELASLVNVPGRGIEGRFGNEPVRIGNYAFCEPVIPVCFRKHTKEIVERVKSGGGIPVVIAHGGETLVLALADTPREGAEELATQLHNVGVQTVTMLTGDQKVIAERVARELGIDDVHAELMPEDKVEQIRQLKKDNIVGGVAVIGDGVNDAPALAVADVGLAMGGIGADAALETADVVLLHDDLNRIPWAIHLARRVKGIMMANLAFATAVIVLLATVTVILGIPLSLGVLGHEGSTLLVVANSLRLLAHRGP